ncbi:MAG: hypothetical protein NVSMB17_04990 [Candidatus Dormibacteria bacterium]
MLRQATAGQAMVEFALAAPLFFFALFFALSAGFYTLERASAVNATTAGARIAAGADDADLNRPALLQAREETVRLLASGMPGTRVLAPPGPADGCPDLGRIPTATIYVCVTTEGADRVRVQAIGRPASFVSPQVGGLSLPLEIYAVVHTAVFKP